MSDIGLRTDPEAPASRAAPSDPPSKTRGDSCSSHYWRSRCGNLNTTDLNTTDLGQGHDVPLIGSESVGGSTYEGESPRTLCLVPGKGDDVVVAAEPRFRSVAGPRPMWGSCRGEPNHELCQRNLQTDAEGSMR